MKTLTKTKKLFVALAAALVCFVTLCMCMFTGFASADEQSSDDMQDSDVAPNILLSFSLAINGGDGRVYGSAKNEFTLFPSTVYARVELYRSVERNYSYENMELVSVNSTNDLNMGETIIAEYPTNGVEAYWVARCVYRDGSGDWQEKYTKSCHCDGNGDLIETI